MALDFNATALKRASMALRTPMEMTNTGKSTPNGNLLTKDSTCFVDSTNNNLAFEENADLDLSQLEQESNRLMESIA